jgi:dTMP kinase
LLYAARRDHVSRTIEPALATGRWVVCDRFTDSTIAYQGYGRGLRLADLATLQRLALGDFRPNLTLILDLPVAEGLARAARRAGAADRFERLDREFHQRLRDGFLAIAKSEAARCVLIDASAEVGEVHRTVLAALASQLGIVLT